MPLSKCHLNEYRIKKYMKESPWSKYERLKELQKLKMRCKNVLPASDRSCPRYSTHVLVNRRRADIEEVLGGASNWIGKYKDEPKKLCDARPWRSFNNARPHPAPFSTLKLSPRGDKMRVIERNLMEMYERIKEVEDGPSQYAIVKKSYLSRGDSPWPKPPSRTTAEDKLEQVKKWEMKHHPRAKTVPAGFFASLFGTGTAPKPIPKKKPATAPAATKTRPASAPLKSSAPAPAPAPVVETKEPEPESISSVTQEDAVKDEKLAQLKAVQEAGDANF